MKNILFKKGVVVGIIVLLSGIAINPIISGNSEIELKISNTKMFQYLLLMDQE